MKKAEPLSSPKGILSRLGQIGVSHGKSSATPGTGLGVWFEAGRNRAPAAKSSTCVASGNVSQVIDMIES